MFGILASYIFFTSLPNTDPNRNKQETLNDDMIFYNLKHKNSLFWTPVLDDSSIGNHLELKRPRASDDIWPAVYRWQWICFQMDDVFSSVPWTAMEKVCRREAYTDRSNGADVSWGLWDTSRGL